MSKRKHFIKLGIELVGLTIAISVFFIAFGCQTAGVSPRANDVIVAVNSIVNGSGLTNAVCMANSANMTNVPSHGIQILVSFRDPVTTTASQTTKTDASVPVSLTNP